MSHWERLLVKFVLVLLILAGISPLLGQATLAQTLVLGSVVASVLYFLGDLVLPRLLRAEHGPLAAVGEGLIAALILRYLALALGARFSPVASLVFGAAVGLAGYYWYGRPAEQVEGARK